MKTIEQACEYLNNLLDLDKTCIVTFVERRISCNEGIQNHPTVVVTEDNTVGLLGIFNGLFSDEHKVLAVEVNENEEIQRFIVLSK